MPRKPRRADDYRDAITAASRSGLAEIMTALGAYRDALVLIGGWAPHLILERFGYTGFVLDTGVLGADRLGGVVHVGSIDIDLVVDPVVIDAEQYATIVELLLDRVTKETRSRAGSACDSSADGCGRTSTDAHAATPVQTGRSGGTEVLGRRVLPPRANRATRWAQAMTGRVDPGGPRPRPSPSAERPLADSPEDLRVLDRLCREGRLYDIERWIAEGRPLQFAPEAVPKGTRPKTALQIALESGQHSLVLLLLRHGYRLDLERYRPLDMALRGRRWDLVDLLLEWGADLKSADVYTVLNTYHAGLYERFRAAEYDLTERHEMGAILGHGTRNRPLLGFVKRHRTEDPKIQTELNIALGSHVRAGNERGVNLCLWAGADPHAPAPDLDWGVPEDPDPGQGEAPFIGWTALEEAAREGHLSILKRLGPDPARDDFDELYKHAKYESMVAFLTAIHPPKDLTAILWWHLRWMVDRLPWFPRTGSGTVEALLTCGVRWEDADRDRLAGIRRLLVKAEDYDLKKILRHLKRPEICAPQTYEELIRTPKMRQRLLALGVLKKPVSEGERGGEELRRLTARYDRTTLYEEVWARPVQEVAKSHGVSGVALAKACRKLQVPVPPRGYWARLRHGHPVRKPSLPRLDARE